MLTASVQSKFFVLSGGSSICLVKFAVVLSIQESNDCMVVVLLTFCFLKALSFD